MTRPRDIADSINRINSSAADATAMTIDANESVGIGTSSPSTPLHVKSATDNSIFLMEHTSPSTGTGQTSMFIDGSSNATVTYDSNGVYKIGTTTNPVNGAGFTEHLRIQSGGGISFNGDTAAANALDDYEEGTWTVSIQFGGANCTSTTARARYIKVGNMVHVSATVQVTGTPASGNFEIGGLPFAASGNVETTGSVMFNNVGYNANTVNLCVYLYNVVSTANVYGTVDGGGWYPLSNSHIGTGDSIIFSLIYYT